MNSNFNISNRFYRVGLKYKPYKTDVKNEILAKLKIKAITLAEASREYEVPKSTIKHWLRNLSDNLSQNKDVTTNETTMIIETITEATTSTTRNKSTSTMTDDYPKVDKEQQTDCNDKNDTEPKETETEAKTTDNCDENEVLKEKNDLLSKMVDITLDYGIIAAIDFMLSTQQMPYKAVDVVGDGNCLFRSVGFKQVNQKISSVRQFRAALGLHLSQNEKKFLNKFRSLEIYEEGQIENILKNIQSKDYADNVDFILIVAADYLNANIHSYMFNRKGKSIIEVFKCEDPSYTDNIAILHNGLPAENAQAHYYYLRPR